MHMIDVMTKLKEIAEGGYDNEDIQRGIVAAGKHQVEEAEVTEEEAVDQFVEEAADEVVDEAEVAEEEAVEEEAIEEDDVEEVHEEEDTSLADMLRLAGRSGVMGLNQNNLIAESIEDLDEEDELEEHTGDKPHAHPHEDDEEEVEEGDDYPTYDQMKKRDEIYKSMKKERPEYKEKYGGNWKGAMQAIALKKAMDEEAVSEDEVEETVEVPVSALQDLMRLAGYENYEAKIDEYENDPEEEYMDSEEQLIGLSGGLNGPKTMHPTAAGGDNAMSVRPLKVDEEDNLSFESFYKKYEEFVTEEK